MTKFKKTDPNLSRTVELFYQKIKIKIKKIKHKKPTHEFSDAEYAFMIVLWNKHIRKQMVQLEATFRKVKQSWKHFFL